MRTRANNTLVGAIVTISTIAFTTINNYVYPKNEIMGIALLSIILIFTTKMILIVVEHTYNRIDKLEVQNIKNKNREHWIKKRNAIKRKLK